MSDFLVSNIPFFIVDNATIDSEGFLTSNEKLLYVVLRRYGDSPFPSLNTLAKKSGLSRTTVKKCINDLIKKGIITKQTRYHKNGGRTSNIYTFTNILAKKETPATSGESTIGNSDYNTEQVKKQYGYEAMKHDFPDLSDEIELCMNIIDKNPNAGEIPILDMYDIIYAVQQYDNHRANIKAPEPYLFSILQKAHSQHLQSVKNMFARYNGGEI